MRLLIIEDEYHAAQRLQKLIKNILDDAEILEVIDSVEEAVEWFRNNEHPDLVFMDIQLADDISFSIFNHVEIEVPIVFTTAYNEYSLQAFKVNSIDYLLKPVEEDEVRQAITKFNKLHNKDFKIDSSLSKLIKGLSLEKSYKERFLTKSRDRYHFILSDEIAYFYSEDSVTFLVTNSGRTRIYDATLSQLKEELNPKHFYQINRKWIVHLKSIKTINTYFNNRLILQLEPKSDDEVVVSREKVKGFKEWLDE